MGIAVLGPLTVDDSGALGRRDRIILEALVARAGQPVSADQLADAVWGDRPPASAAKNVQGCVVRLRKLLGPDAVLTSSHGYQLVLPVDEVDARRFERSVARSRELLLLGEHDRAAFQLTEALALWRGEPFGDLEGWPGAETEVRRLLELRLDAEELRVEAYVAGGRCLEVLSEAQALVTASPMRERRWALLAHAQYLAGRQGEALRTIHRLKGVLAEHLGIDPGPDVVALEEAILRQDDSLLAAAIPGEARTVCPYQGLLAYELDDVDRFFGRDSDVQACLAVLRRSPLLALVGPSGTGKSSLLRAGLAAALRDTGHASIVVTPGRHPLQAISVLTFAPAATALLVDQFEETFTLCDDPDERTQFIGAVLAELDRRMVVIALRSDRMADLAAHPDLASRVEVGLHLVAGMTEDGLRQAVEAPARQSGLHLEPGLVDLLVREVQGDPGALPLFSHALLETWKRREGNTLTVDGYRASGGIHGAVAQSAERLYAHTDREHRPLLRDLVLRLVSPGPEGEPVRTRVPRRLIAADADHDRMVDALVAARLVTSDDGALEITHEALARAWPRLRSWLDDDVEGQRLLHHLSAAADAWNTMGRPDSELYRGVRLVRALDWQGRTTASLTDTERAFLDRARTVADIEEQTAAERARSQARLIRRLRVVLSGAVVLFILAILAGWVAAGQSNRAGRNEAEARVAAEAARQAALSKDARQVGARSQLTDDISLALLLAAAGARLDDSPEARATLFDALARQPLLVRSAPPAGGFLEALEASPNGRWIASSDDQNRMHLYDAATNELRDTYDAGLPPGADQAWMFSAFSPDSRRLAVIPEGGQPFSQLELLDPTTMESTTELEIPGDEAVWGVDVTFSADGRHVAASVTADDWFVSDSSEIPSFGVVWDLRSPSRPQRVRIGSDVQALALSPDGRILYTGSPLTAYDVASGARLWRRGGVSTPYYSLDVNPQGTLLAMAVSGPDGCERDALLVSTSDGATVHTLSGQRGSTCEAHFSRDGALVGAVSGRGELIVWQTATGELLERWHTFDPQGIAFGPDNDLVHAGGRDSMLRTWDLSAQESYLKETVRVRDMGELTHADFSPDGRQVAYRWLDPAGKGRVKFVDVTTGRTTDPARLPTQPTWWPMSAWHPDGGQYTGWCARASGPCPERGEITVLDTTTGLPVHGPRDIVDGDGDIHGVAFVDEGRSLLVSTSDLRTNVLDAETLQASGGPFDFGADLVVPIGDGSTAVVSEVIGDGTFERWRWIDIGTGDVRSDWVVNTAFGVAASPDGSTLAVAGLAGEILTVDIASGAAQRRSTSVGAPVLWLDWSDDGEMMVTGTEDGGVSLWDAATLELLGTVHPPRHGKTVPSGVHFIGDTHDVVIASYDGTVYRWETDLERALDFACQMAGRDMTEAEWEQVLPNQPYRSVCPQS